MYIVNDMEYDDTMSISQRLDVLRNYQTPSMLEGVNKIYFLEVFEKPGLVKIGDTHREVEQRNKETLTNASLHKSSPVTWVIAKDHNGKPFRDKKFHKFLENKGFKRELNDQKEKSEWFYITLHDALFQLELFIQKPVYEVAEIRPAQHYMLENLAAATRLGRQYINMGACVRIGKTIISLTHAANNNWMPVYIGKNLTSQSSAEADNAKFGIVPEMLTQSIHGTDEELTGSEVTKRVAQIIINIDAANTSNKDIVFYVDEVDDASHTKRSRDIIVPVVEHYRKLGKFAQIITMSGTRIYRGEKILRDLTDGEITELGLEYFEMQLLQPETTVKRNFRHISYYTEGKNDLVNISDAMKTKEGRNSLLTAVDQLLGDNNFDIETNSEFPHWFIKFATVGKTNADSLVAAFNKKYKDTDYIAASINGNFTKAKEAQGYCKKIIEDNPGKICVFVSQGMATTSFSVVGIGNSCVFTDNELTSDDVQALHRSATWAPGKLDCNMVVITTNDSMEHTFDDVFEDETKMAHSREDKIELYKELLLNNSMVHYTVNGSVRPVRVTEANAGMVIDKKQQAMTKIASIMNVLNDLDEELLDEIYLSVEGKKATSKKATTKKGETFDPFSQTKPDVITVTRSSDDISKAKKEQILRAFAENATMVPAIAREQETTIEEFDFWAEVNVDKDLFFEVYNNSWMFRDRIDTIYGLCEDDNYLASKYIDKFKV